MGFYGFDWPCLNAVLSFSCIPTAGFPDASSHTCRNRIRTKNIKTQDLSYKICLALQDLAVLLNENPLSSPGKLSLPCLSHPWFACFHFFARRKYELTTKSKRFSMIFIFIALFRPVSDKFAVHLPRYFCESVSGVLSLLSTWHGIPAKVFQVSFPAVHLARNSSESVPGASSPPSTWHGIPAKACQVALPVVHLARNPRESVPGVSSPPSTCHGISAKAFQVSLPASHLARNPRKSVAGVFLCLPPGTESPRKRSRCLSLPSTCHGFPAKVFQVSFPASPPGTEFPRKRGR